jgi:hypothetical protein
VASRFVTVKKRNQLMYIHPFVQTMLSNQHYCRLAFWVLLHPQFVHPTPTVRTSLRLGTATLL